MGIADARAMYPVDRGRRGRPGGRPPAARRPGRLVRPLHAAGGARRNGRPVSRHHRLRPSVRRRRGDARRHLSRASSSQGFDVRAGLASTPGAAWAAARFSSGDGILDAGRGGSTFWRPCRSPPCASIPASAPAWRASACARSARSWRRRARRSSAASARRCCSGSTRRWAGSKKRSRRACRCAPLSVERHFAEPIALIEDIERLVLMLSASLKQDLERRGEGARSLQLLLFRVDGAVSRIAVGTSRPLARAAPHRQAFPREAGSARSEHRRRLWFRSRPAFGLRHRARSRRSRPISPAKRRPTTRISRCSPTASAPGSASEAVLKPVLVESHIPERAALLVPFAEASLKGSSRQTGRKDLPRPAALCPSVRSGSSRIPSRSTSRRPRCRKVRRLNFHWRRALHRVARAEGPERIAPEWWRRRARRPTTRDYFRVEDANGRRYWLYREGLYGAAESNAALVHAGLFA